MLTKEILLVEATPALLTSRVKTLERQGYNVTGASTAGEVTPGNQAGVLRPADCRC